MIRERRKSFHLATQRISEYSNSLNLSQSTIFEAGNSEKSSPRPTRRSEHFKCSTTPIVSSSTPKKRKSSSNKSKHEAAPKTLRIANRTNESPTATMSAEWPKIRLNRMSIEFINQQLSGSQTKPQSQSMAFNGVKAKKIIARRCAINLVREDFPAIDENDNQIEHQSTSASQPLEIDSQNELISNDDGILPSGGQDLQDDVSTFYESESMDERDANTEQDASTEVTTQCSQAILPIITQQFRTSQTVNYVPWLHNRESSLNTGNSSEVQFRRSPKTTSNQTGIVEKKKCFIDSNNVFYGPIVEYKTSKFSVNCLDHSDISIQHHFLSKFDRRHLPALGIFDGDLWVSEITGKDDLKL